MLVNAKELKEACSKILLAIDNTSISNLTGILELKMEDNILYLNVTNKEYFVKLKLGVCDQPFHATVNAELFLKLISQVTTEDIEFRTSDTMLIVKANGNYKFPLIYNDADILNLPEIIIINETVKFNIDGSILNSIFVNNSKELTKIPKNGKLAINPIQKMYYVDEQGAITFYNGACVNKFTLEKPVKMLLNSNLVKLFSLFKNTIVDFTMGYDALSDDIIQTKVKFETDTICVTAILNCDDTMLKSMPAAAVRARAFNDYAYVATMNRSELLQTIQRLMLFSTNDSSAYKTCGTFVFTKNNCTISDNSKENTEEIKYANELVTDITYEVMLDLNDVKLALESNNDQYITLSFGDHQAFVVAKDNIYTVIPEIVKA